jgi:two-component system, NtrC family, nitrogen regulation response regulator GlnG
MSLVWIVDDDRSIRWVLEKALDREAIAHRSFESATEVRAALSQTGYQVPTVLVSDVRMPGESGLTLLKSIKAAHPQLPVIIMTAYSDLDTAVQAFQGGAFEYLPKPFDVEQAVALVRRAMNANSGAELAASSSTAQPLASEQRDMLGKSAPMQDVFRAIGRLSNSHVTVLITGESGTGKELVARALHEHSPRTGKPFIAINTAAIPKDLLESELFGHERGSFTGAAATRQGRFQQAEGGTLFLDEIGDMPADLQVRLLRVLQDGEYYRVGGQAPMKSNVRIIAATHQNLDERVKQGLFREDLLHRLNVVRLRLPPLRERRDDVPLLMKHFLAKSAQTLGGEPKVLSARAMTALQNFGFPGNVRQLENMCHWITVMAPGQSVDIGDLPPEVTPSQSVERNAELVATSAAASFPQTAASPAMGPVTNPANDAAATSASPVAAGATPREASEALWRERLADAMVASIRANETAPGDRLTREFEETLIRAALSETKGRRIEASMWLGWGRNTLTRKIQELGLDQTL